MMRPNLLDRVRRGLRMQRPAGYGRPAARILNGGGPIDETLFPHCRHRQHSLCRRAA